jgi:tetratricopeptide (TPR) repeat protein
MRKHELVESLLELTDAGLLLRDGQSTIPAHPLVSEALRGRLPHPARRAVAQAVAATLERDAEAGASPSLWWDAAESWRVADNPERAIHALKRCARHALEIGRPGEAARILDHAVSLPQSAEQLVELSTALIGAASAANEFPLVMRGAERLRAAGGDQPHNELEMAELRAFFGLTTSEPATAERLLPCIRADDATPAHRLEAAISLLKCADNVGREDLRQIAIAETRGSDLANVNTVMRLEFEILVASTQGNRRHAASFGRALIRHLREVDDHSETRLAYYISGALALHLGGFVSEAIVEYERLIELGQRRGAPRSCLSAAVQLASLHFDAGRDSEADRWMQMGFSLVREWPELADDFGLATTRLEIDLFRGDLQSAKKILSRLSSQIPQTNRLQRRWLEAGLVAVKSAGRQLSHNSRAVLSRIGRDRLSSISGIRDFEVAVVVEAMIRLDLADDAYVTLTEYLASERHRDRLPTRLLSRAMSSTRVSELLPSSGAGDCPSPVSGQDQRLAGLLTNTW